MTAAFRLGVISDEISQRIEDAIRIARQYGLGALELRSLDGQQLHLLSDERLEQIHSKMITAGLSVCGLSSPVFKCDLDNEEAVSAHRDMLVTYAKLAQRLEAPVIRGFSFWAKGDFHEVKSRIIHELKLLVPVLEEHRVTLALEADPSVYASNAAKVAALVKEVDSPWVQGLFDPGNDLWDPDEEVPYPDGYEALKGHICHIHLKDAVRKNGQTEAVAIGQGQVDYSGLLGRLKKDGYEGWLVVETHYRLHSTLTEEQLKRPAGYAFSEGGEAATIHCLDHLFQLLREQAWRR